MKEHTTTGSFPCGARRVCAGTTLVEAVIGSVIIMIAGLGVVASIMFGLYSQQYARERDAASRLAATYVEQAKRSALITLRPQTTTGTLDTRGTPPNYDDITATVNCTMRDMAGNVITVPPSTGYPMIEYRVSVQWYSAGKRGRSQQKTELLSTYLTP